jgi:hypothetical protein
MRHSKIIKNCRSSIGAVETVDFLTKVSSIEL